MQYNIAEFKRQIEDTDGGYKAVAKEYGASVQQIHKLLNRSESPRLSSMKKLIDAIDQVKKNEAKVVAEHPEFFLT